MSTSKKESRTYDVLWDTIDEPYGKLREALNERIRDTALRYIKDYTADKGVICLMLGEYDYEIVWIPECNREALHRVNLVNADAPDAEKLRELIRIKRNVYEKQCSDLRLKIGHWLLRVPAKRFGEVTVKFRKELDEFYDFINKEIAVWA